MHEAITTAATALAEAIDSDVLLYSGAIERPYDDKLLDLLAGLNKRTNVILFLCTRGGNADAAYRMARGLQDNYKKFTVVIAGRCKSAGTLFVIGAHEIVMTDHAELGPLDVQIGKKDELFELDSGLTVLDALSELENKAFEFFERAMISIKVKSEGTVTFKSATHVATELAKAMVTPIMAQIDPMHVGEVSRALKIGQEYGHRLGLRSMNLHDHALKTLVEGYPSHGFVIDRNEAHDLFLNVRTATDAEMALIKLGHLKSALRIPVEEETVLSFLSEEQKEANHDIGNAQNAGARGGPAEEGHAATAEVPGGEEPAGTGAEESTGS